MQAEAQAQVDGLIEAIEGRPDALCVFDADWHEGVVGLVAGRIADRLQRPVVAFAPSADNRNLLKGSARSPAGVHMRDVLVSVDSKHLGLIAKVGGHARAAALTLAAETLDEFRSALLSVIAH